MMTSFMRKSQKLAFHQSKRRYSIQYSSTNTKVQFVLRYTKEGGSSTDCLINHLKSEHRIHEGENHKTIPAQEEIRSQIFKKEMCLFAATKKRSNDLEKIFQFLNYNQTQISGTRKGFFNRGTICHKTQTQTESWKCALIVISQYHKHQCFLRFLKGYRGGALGVNTIFPAMSDTSNSFSQKRNFPSIFGNDSPCT